MAKSRKRLIGIGCGVAAGILVLVYLTLGLVNLASNDTNQTHQLKKKIDALEHARNEFVDSRDRDGLVRGRYVGVSKIDGAAHHHVQFDGVLEGDDRILDIHFAHELFEAAIVAEAGKKQEGEAHAFLLMQKTCCLDQDFWYELFEMDVGDTTSPVDLFADRLDYVIEDPPPEIFFAHLDYGNVFDFSTRWIQWEQRGAGQWVVVGRGSSMQQPYELDVDWVQRDRSQIRKWKWGYALTGPLDVVGWPVEVLLLVAIGVGGVR